MVKLFKGFLRRRATKQITPLLEKELGSKSLAFLAKTNMAYIGMYGKDVVRVRTIKAIEKDAKRDSWEEMLNDCLRTPEYMAMLKALDMDETHLRLIIEEQRKGL